MNRTLTGGLLAIIALVTCAPGALAQDFTLEQSVIAPGGESSTGDNWTLDATLGQPAAGVAEGDDFVLFAGFWVPDSVEPPLREIFFADGFEGDSP